MARIHITGNAGSGKSTFAARLGDALGIPVFSLDQFIFVPGYKLAPASVRDSIERELVSQRPWIIEGYSAVVRDSADTVIFLDVSRRTALSRCARRNWRYLFKSRPGMPVRCPEYKAVPMLLGSILLFNARCRPSVLHDLERAKGTKQSFHVRTKDELERTFDELVVAGRLCG